MIATSKTDFIIPFLSPSTLSINLITITKTRENEKVVSVDVSVSCAKKSKMFIANGKNGNSTQKTILFVFDSVF